MQIQKNIPRLSSPGAGMVEIIRKMEIGDSFLLPEGLPMTRPHAVADYVGVKISVRTTDEGIRVWRVS